MSKTASRKLQCQSDEFVWLIRKRRDPSAASGFSLIDDTVSDHMKSSDSTVIRLIAVFKLAKHRELYLCWTVSNRGSRTLAHETLGRVVHHNHHQLASAGGNLRAISSTERHKNCGTDHKCRGSHLPCLSNPNP